MKATLFKFIFASVLIGMGLGCMNGKSTLPKGFVYLDEVAPEIVVDLRYYSTRNFVGDTIDGYQNSRCIATAEMAHALKKVQQDLRQYGFGLKVFDAYRPQMAVDHFVRWAKDIDDTLTKHIHYPEVNKANLFEKGYIAERSGHSRGSSVDLTLIHLSGSKKGQALDMGTPWDFFSTKSWPLSNEVTEGQKANRMLLRDAMGVHGFRALKEEWWHFTLNNEPHPKTYFNFPVK